MIFKFTDKKYFVVKDTVVDTVYLEDRYFTDGLLPQGFEGFFYFDSEDEAKEFFNNSYDESLIVSSEAWLTRHKNIYDEKRKALYEQLEEELPFDEEAALAKKLNYLEVVYHNSGNPYTINWDLITQEPTE
jgi:hypothetical protein